MLYTTPKARVRTNDWISAVFPLARRTQQGYHLSPSLFALALEPLAIHVQSSQLVEGRRIGPPEEKILLYADDTLLYPKDANSSLWAALAIFDEFGHFSGVKINWIRFVSTGLRCHRDGFTYSLGVS